MKSKPGGGNVPHMRYVQDARRSNETGFHDKSKRQKNRQDRRKATKELRPQSWSESSFFMRYWRKRIPRELSHAVNETPKTDPLPNVPSIQL